MPRAPRRTGTEDCIHYLGEVGAFMFFVRAALDPDATGADLLRWTLRLQQALLAKPADVTLKPLKIDAPQISTWRRANPIVWESPLLAGQTLSLRALAIEVAGPMAHSPAWKGHLLMVFEPHSETLVHHFLKLNRTAEVSTDWILYVLGRADQAIRERTAALRGLADSVSIALPDLKDTPYEGAYAEAATRIKAALPRGCLSATWLGRNMSTLALHNAHVDQTAAHHVHDVRHFKTSQIFRNALLRTAREFTALTNRGGEAWIALTPLKGDIDRKPGWADPVWQPASRRNGDASR